MTDTLLRSGRVVVSELEGMDLGEHDGLPITRSAASITRAGDGLSESLAMKSLHLPVQSEVVIVVPARVRRHSYERLIVDKVIAEEFVETTTYEAQAAFFIDPDLLEEAIAKHMTRRDDYRREQDRLRQEAKGHFELPLIESAEAE